MKWLMVKMVMMLAIGFGILNYALYLKTGKSPLADMDWSMPKFTVPDMATLKDAIPDVDLPSMPGIGENTEGKPIEVYKWVDADGVINYSQTKPESSVSAEVMMVDPQTNVVQADKLPEPEPEKPVAEAKPAPAPSLPDMSLLPTPDRVKQLMDDAKGIQTQMDDRAKMLESVVNGAMQEK